MGKGRGRGKGPKGRGAKGDSLRVRSPQDASIMHILAEHRRLGNLPGPRSSQPTKVGHLHLRPSAGPTATKHIKCNAMA